MDAAENKHDSALPDHEVSLVIPGRDCASTLRSCLDAVVAIRGALQSALREIIFVNDGSVDDSAAIAASYGDDVRVITGNGDGPAAARNLGWRSASSELIWFVDSDCVAEPDALTRLLPHMDDQELGGVSGSYLNLQPRRLLARLIHEEIIARHCRMGMRVDFLATFNVLYRRAALVTVDGFDPRYRQGQDAELAFRVSDAGYTLGFEIESRVGHFHETVLRNYLRTQRRQGYWRVWLHLEHRGHSTGDSYSSVIDHIQPPLAMALLASVPVAALCGALFDGVIRIAAVGVPLLLLMCLVLAQVPMTVNLISRTRSLDMAFFAVLSSVRSIWRGVGMTLGVVHFLGGRHRRMPQEPSS